MAWDETTSTATSDIHADVVILDAITDTIKAAVEAASGITIAPTSLSAANDTVSAGYYAATTLSAVDAELAVGNIKHGVNIFGKVGTYDTEAVVPIAAGTVLSGKKGRVNGATITGTMPNNAGDVEGISAHPGATTHIHIVPAEGYVDGSDDAVVLDLLDVTTEGAKLITGNIKAGVTLFGVAGKTEVVDTTTGTAVDTEILATKVAWVDGVEITGTMANNSGAVESLSAHAGVTTHIHVVPTSGYYNGSTGEAIIDLTAVAVAGADLVTANIKSGATIFGVAGTSTVVDVAATTAVAGDVATGKIFYLADGTQEVGEA
jgi:hypothetical protein